MEVYVDVYVASAYETVSQGTQVAGLHVQMADDFSFTDSVDGSVSSKQGLS
jgi:hypothetical protein